MGMLASALAACIGMVIICCSESFIMKKADDDATILITSVKNIILIIPLVNKSTLSLVETMCE